MTVLANDSQISITAVGGETSLDFDFLIYAASDLLVVKRSTSGTLTTLALTTDYTVPNGSLNDPDGGTINLVSAATAGEVYTLAADIPESRSANYQQAGDLRAATVNADFDKLVRITQQLRRDVDAAISIPTGGVNIDAEGAKIVNLGTPTVSTDAVTKGYADTLAVTAGNVPSPALADVGKWLKATATGVFGWASLGLLAAKDTIATADIDNGAVTYAKIQDVSAASRLLGRGSASGAGDAEELTAANGVGISTTELRMDINGMTAIGAAVDGANDLLPVYDASATAPRKVAIDAVNYIVGSTYTEYTTVASLTTAMPVDDTIPQNTEGAEILSVSYAAKTTTNKLRLRFQGWGSQTSGSNKTAGFAIFGSDSANAKAAGAQQLTSGSSFQFHLEVEITPGSTSSRTYSVRIGTSDGSAMNINGVPTVGRLFGGVSRATLTIEEIRA